MTVAVSLILVVLSALAHALHWSAPLTFAIAASALVPLAAVLGKATEEVAMRQGPAIGGLLNATFGNATELILAVLSIRAGGPLLDMVKASLTGSVIGNLLLVLGASIVAGGMRYKTMAINPRGAGMATSMMMLAVVGLVVPALFAHVKPTASSVLLQNLSLAVALVLMAIYVLGLVFSLGTHRHVFNPDAEEEGEQPQWSLLQAVVVLFVATGFVVLESEWLVDAVQSLIVVFHLSPLFLGAVVVAIVGNAAEHAVAVMVARRGKMELAFQIACGSSTQVALFVAPFLVFASMVMGQPLNLVFTLFEVMAIVVSVVIVAMISADGETNWFEGAQLLGVYAILCIAFFYL